MRARGLSWLPLFAAVAAAWPAIADPAAPPLRWTPAEARLRLTSADTTGKAIFVGTNPGERTVAILGVDAGCACTDPALSADEVPPGGETRLELTFEVGARRGNYRFPVRVQTNEPLATTILWLDVEIRDLVQLSPGQVLWRRGEPAEARIVALRWDPADAVSFEGFTASPDRFTVSAKNTPEGVDLHITPPATDRPAYTVLTLRTRQGPAGKPRNYTVLARVL